MKGNVSTAQAVTSNERPLSPRVQEALGELVGVAQEGLLARCRSAWGSMSWPS